MPDDPVVIVGAGLAGLACARRLAADGVAVTLLEASDGPGGRVRSDVVDGHVLDRGFQVLLTAYPEVRRVLDLEALDLRPFMPGAMVFRRGRFHTLGDPLRDPSVLVAALRAPVATLADKARVGALLAIARVRGAPERPGDEAGSAREWLGAKGFSPEVTEAFFRPFFGGGVLLDPTLATAARQLAFVLRTFACGPVAVPGAGMGAISDQLAAALPAGTLRTGTRVRAVEPGTAGPPLVTLDDGSTVAARAVVVAAEAPAAAALLPDHVTDGGSRPAGCLWFGAAQSPLATRAVLVDGDGEGPVTNAAVLSNVAPTYAPDGRALIAASLPSTAVDEDAVRAQLRRWFGPAVDQWDLLRTDRIPHAQPAQPPAALEPVERPVRVTGRVYVCGDHRDNASINGALVSGRRAAEAVLADAAADR
ncbi:MAG: NAD(P)/FAD-dependent oxidoreductase [Acidimicrobiales bacterium]